MKATYSEKNCLTTLRAGSQLCHWYKDNLCLELNFFGLALFHKIAAHSITETPLRLKELYSEFTPSAVRRNLRALETLGWAITSTHENDARTKMVTPSKKFQALSIEYVDLVESLFKDSPRSGYNISVSEL